SKPVLDGRSRGSAPRTQQASVTADPVGQAPGQQRRLQRTLDKDIVISLDVACPLFVVVDAMAVVGGGTEEEHLRFVDGHGQHRDHITGVDVLEIRAHAGLAIIDVVASATSSRLWLRYSARQVTTTNVPDLPSFSTIDSTVRVISISSPW